MTSAKTKSLIQTRIKEGFSIDDFKTVIRIKYQDWHKTDQEKYLRPITLFGTKFESYLNQKQGKKEKTPFEYLKNKHRPKQCKQCGVEISERYTTFTVDKMLCKNCNTFYSWNGNEWIIDK